MMPKHVLILCLLVVFAVSDSSMAQRRRPGGRLGGSRPSGGIQIQKNGDATNRRQDVEGTIWEFKVMDNNESNKSKRTKMMGKFRIKQTSLFAVGKVEVKEPETSGSGDSAQMMKEFDKNGDQQLNSAELDALLASMRSGNGSSSSSQAGNRGGRGVQGELNSLLSQRINSAQEEQTGGERIGDMTKSQSSEKTFRFDEDDDHPLSGMVVVQPDKKTSDGTWVGRYDEFVDGKKKKRWRFEMRKIEE